MSFRSKSVWGFLMMMLLSAAIACQGAQGVPGAQGEQGPQGIAGPQGPVGPQGLQGEQGPEGPPGPRGPQGERGSQGLAGLQGIQGERGEQGPPGLEGPQGERGPAGPQGTSGGQSPTAQVTPRPPSRVVTGAAIDVHTRLLSSLIGAGITGRTVEESDANDLIERLNEANIQKAVVSSNAYALIGQGGIRSENRFVSTQISRFPNRLVGLCGINPLVADALDEIDDCLELPGMVGVSLHLPDSNLNLADQRHLMFLSQAFDKIGEHDAPLLLQIGTPLGLPLGSQERENLTGIILEHPAVRIVFAQCAGPADEFNIELWIQSFEARLPDFSRENLFLDLAGCLAFFEDAPLSKREEIVWRLRKWELDRVFFGSDYLEIEPTQTPIEALVTLVQYPFTQEEIDLITNNDASAWLSGTTR